jgi:hypothetical protein
MIDFLKAILWRDPEDPVSGDPALRPGGQVARHLRTHAEAAVDALGREEYPLALKIAVLEVSQCYRLLLTLTWAVIGGVATFLGGLLVLLEPVRGISGSPALGVPWAG